MYEPRDAAKTDTVCIRINLSYVPAAHGPGMVSSSDGNEYQEAYLGRGTGGGGGSVADA
jgi:hypothetical protein